MQEHDLVKETLQQALVQHRQLINQVLLGYFVKNNERIYSIFSVFS
jgi:hypothetical protein